MAENDHSTETVSPSEASDAQNIAALADLLDDDPTEDHAEEVEADAEPEAEDEDEAQADAEDDAEGEEAPDDEEDESEDDRLRDEQGRFVSPDDKVRLRDGTVTTVGALSESPFYQADYSRKTAEVAEQRKQAEEQIASYNEAITTVQQQHELLTQAIDNMKPQRPQASPEEDLMGWAQYQAGVEQFNEWQQWAEARRTELQKQKEDTDLKAENDFLRRERDSLLTAMPELRDKDKHRRFLTEAAEVMKQFGYTEDEVFSTKDHRGYLLANALVKATRALKKAPAAKKDVEAKPKMVKGSRRVPQNRARNRAKQKNMDRLKTEGSFRAGVAALSDLDDL